MTKKVVKKRKGLTPSMVVKNEKVNEYIYVLSNGQELAFKDKIFPISKSLISPNGQITLF